MPYNKGDFTQQGVAGHVNANLRLNEKRLVNIDLTSNEEAEGCTIAGTVKDLLNDKVYGIGSGVSGNIEITENGENINVAPYATATVNVSGGGGLPKCTITLVNDPTSDDPLPISMCIKDYVMLNNNYVELPIQYDTNPLIISVGDSFTFDGLYQHISFEDENWYFSVRKGDLTTTASNAVNCSFTDGTVFITDTTADSSITLTFLYNR